MGINNWETTMKDQGTTKERFTKSTVITEVRETTRGGIAKSYGQRETEPTFLDYLKARGQLGTDKDAQERYNAGMKLHDLWFRFHCESNDFNEAGSARIHFTVGDKLTPTEQAQESFNAVMRALPIKYKLPAQQICIDGHYPTGIQTDRYLIHDTLDALTGAFYRTEKMR